MNTWTVTLNRGSLSETIVDISARLKAQTKATKDEILRTELLVEEMFLRMQKGMDGGDDFSVDITPRRAWGDIELCLKTKGPEYNPMPDVAETGQHNANEEEDLNLVILKWNRKKMSYSYKNATNQVTIKVHELDSGKKQLINTVTGLVLGVVCGLLMQTFLDKETLATINGDAITPLRDMLMNALKMMMAPVTFFAIIAGVTNVSDTALLGKLGGKMVNVSLFMQLMTAFVGLGLGIILFSSDLSYMQSGIVTSGNSAENMQYPSLTDLFFGIVPKNVVDPFKGDNILQVMFLAIFFGIVLNKMGEKARAVNECIDFMFRFVLAVLKIIVTAIPLIVFLSMTSLLANTGVSSLISFSRLFAGLAIGVVLVWGIGAVTVLLFARISPIHLTRKLIVLSPLVFSVSSSHARLIFVLKFCAEKLGIDSKLSAFSIPVGVQLNKAGNCIFFSLVIIMMMRVYGIELTPSLFFTLLVSVCVMAVAKPPVPCGGIICIAYLFTVVGVPAEAISLILCVDPIAAMFNGVCNESANITTSFILAKSNKMLNEQTYFSR
jgi:Na+/H+-dicarboxylate symporter